MQQDLLNRNVDVILAHIIARIISNTAAMTMMPTSAPGLTHEIVIVVVIVTTETTIAPAILDIILVIAMIVIDQVPHINMSGKPAMIAIVVETSRPRSILLEAAHITNIFNPIIIWAFVGESRTWVKPGGS